jgi:hypothetical protein
VTPIEHSLGIVVYDPSGMGTDAENDAQELLGTVWVASQFLGEFAEV